MVRHVLQKKQCHSAKWWKSLISPIQFDYKRHESGMEWTSVETSIMLGANYHFTCLTES